MKDWTPDEVFDVNDGSLYCYYGGVGRIQQADDLAWYLIGWAREFAALSSESEDKNNA